VALDGSCNGLQHLSAILRDPVGGAAVNLLPAEKPQDIYTEVLNKVLEVLKEKAARGEPTAQRWIPLMKRKTVKRNVMTLPYGATKTGFADQIMEDTLRPLQRDGACPFSEPYNAARYLGEIVWEATGQVVVAARVAMDWLQECAKIVAKEGHDVQWTTPSGFIVKQDYRKLDSKRVSLKALGTEVFVNVAQGPSPKLDSRKMSASIAPNFVHAMDAAHMLKTVEIMTNTDKSLHFSMVHDSYATHAADAETLSNLIRAAFVQMYQEDDWLERFKEEIEGQTGLELPAVPPQGELVLQDVLSSLYFFA
jgi:DNA-directed RNA polymerase